MSIHNSNVKNVPILENDPKVPMGGSLSQTKDLNTEKGVEKRIRSITQTFEVLCRERGVKWSDIYNDDSLRLDKSYACRIRLGKTIPPLWMRIKIAKVFAVDTSVIWEGC